ncbi:hypothetical protein IC575_030433 [Cucumis melo]
MRIQRLGLESEVLIPELFSGAKVLVVSDIGEERRYSTEVRKERSEGTRLIRRGAKVLD